MTNDNDNNDANSDEKLYLAKSINLCIFEIYIICRALINMSKHLFRGLLGGFMCFIKIHP